MNTRSKRIGSRVVPPATPRMALAAVLALMASSGSAFAAPSRIACIGDSITAGTGASTPAKDWVSDLAGLLGPSVTVGDYGVSGTTMMMVSNSSYWSTGDLPKVESFLTSDAGANEDVAVIIMLGTNDSKDAAGTDNWNATAPMRYAADYNAMIDALQGLSPKPQIFLAFPPPAFKNAYGIDGTVIAEQIIPIIASIATARRLPVIDVHTPLAGMPGLFPDGVHPDDEGHMDVATIMDKGLLSPMTPTPDAGTLGGAAPGDAAAEDAAEDAGADSNDAASPSDGAPVADGSIGADASGQGSDGAADAGAEGGEGTAAGTGGGGGCGCKTAPSGGSGGLVWGAVVGVLGAIRARRGARRRLGSLPPGARFAAPVALLALARVKLRTWPFVVLVACVLGSLPSACASGGPAGADSGDSGAFSADGNVAGSVALDAECRGCDGASVGVDTGIGIDTGVGTDTGTDARSQSCIPTPPASFGVEGVATPDKGMYFDGYDDIVATSQSQTNPGATAYTEVVGFNVPSGFSSGGVLVQFMSGQACDPQSTHYDRAIYMDDVGHLHAGHFSGGGALTVVSSDAYNDGKSHIAALVWDGTNVMLLVDGAVVGGPMAATGPQNFSGYWCIGGGNLVSWPSPPPSYNIEATMGDVAVWQSIALTNAQIASLTMHQSDGTFDATLQTLSPTFWWRLDGDSSIVADSAGTDTGTFNGTVTPCGTSTNLTDSGVTAATLPCDIYQIGGTPCVAAHSTVRALYGAYDGSLYQVTRASDKTSMAIPVLKPGGFANSAQQDAFCSGTTCSITIIYDQSPQGNHLPVSPVAAYLPSGGKPANATAAKITVGGHTVYGVYTAVGGTGTYRINNTKGIATGDEPEAMYMVVDGTRFSSPTPTSTWVCCYDYGNAETDGKAGADGTMEAVYWGSDTHYSVGGGQGPWVKADLENGMYCGDSHDTPSNTSVTGMSYVTAMLKGPSGNHLALKAGNARSGALAIKWDGARPPGYSPMKKEGAIILGTGGDGSDGADGTFFEGCMTSGNPSDAIDDAVQANIVAAGYGQ